MHFCGEDLNQIYTNLEDILKSKKYNFWEPAAPALEIGVNSLGTRRVLQMVGHLHSNGYVYVPTLTYAYILSTTTASHNHSTHLA